MSQGYPHSLKLRAPKAVRDAIAGQGAHDGLGVFDLAVDGMREDPYDNQMGEASVDGRGCRKREMLRKVELIEMLEVPFSD